MGVAFVFLVKSVIPTLFDLGVREFSAVYFFSKFGFSPEPVMISSLILWIVNILIPSLVGTFLVFDLKISEKE
jgi:uncharacterized membrane protein YbhN (UPF0104 family)